MSQHKKILFIYPNMRVGGSTTSLIALLEKLAEDGKYDIDLILRENIGPLKEQIPKQVNLLSPAYVGDKKKLKFRKLLSVRSIQVLVKSLIKRIWLKKACEASQMVEHDTVRYCRGINEKYDVAISFLEQWPLYYMVEKIKADKYIAWVHTDYSKAGFSEKIDYPFFKEVNTIVTVSESCCNSMRNVFQDFSDKFVVIENIISPKLIQELSNEEVGFKVDKAKTNFITVARLDLTSKAFDRSIIQLKRILEIEQYTNWHWYIVGDGPHKRKIEELIHNNGLEQYISLLGEKSNPYAYMCKCDYYLLVSYFEGKPVSVEEAKILGLVPVITNYSTSESQVQDGWNGYICNNSDEGVYDILLKAMREQEHIHVLRENLKRECFDTSDSKRKIERILEGQIENV